jgi:hypothetical protein
VKNFARHGDIVVELSAQVGNVVPLATAMPKSVYEDVPKQISGLFAISESAFAPLVRFNLHRMMWYRYNQYSSDGTLVVGGVNTDNVAILQQSKDAKVIADYNAVFAKDLKA